MQAGLYAAIYLLGLATCLAIGPRRKPVLCCALAFPIGLVAIVAPAVLLAGAGVPYGRPLLGGIALAIAVAAGWAIARQGAPDRRSLRVIAAGTAIFAVAAAALSLESFSIFTFDSHKILMHGQVLVDDHGVTRGLMADMGHRAPFLTFAHSLGPIVGVDYLFALAPVLGLSFGAAFAVILWHASGRLGVKARRRALPVALVTACLFSVYLWQFHLVYVHENLPTAAYLFLFAGSFWLVDTGAEPKALPIAFIALAAFTLLRIENPIAAALFGALVLLPARTSVRALLPWLAGFLVITVGWNLALLAHLPDDGDMKLSAAGVALFIAALVGLAGASLLVRLPALAWVRRRAVHAVAALLGLALIAAFASRHEIMIPAAEVMRANLVSSDEWGLSWIGLALLAAVGRSVVAPPSAQAFTWGVILYLALVLLLAYRTGGYIEGPFDSSMRMALHVLPLAFFYVGLQLALLMRAAAPASAGAASAAGGTSPAA